VSVKTFLLLVAVVGILLFASGLNHWLGQKVSLLLTPADTIAETTIRSRSFFESLSEIGSLRDEVAQLQTENSELKSQLAATQEQLLDVEQSVIERDAADGTLVVTAEVILASPTRFWTLSPSTVVLITV